VSKGSLILYYNDFVVHISKHMLFFIFKGLHFVKQNHVSGKNQ